MCNVSDVSRSCPAASAMIPTHLTASGLIGMGQVVVIPPLGKLNDANKFLGWRPIGIGIKRIRKMPGVTVLNTEWKGRLSVLSPLGSKVKTPQFSTEITSYLRKAPVTMMTHISCHSENDVVMEERKLKKK